MESRTQWSRGPNGVVDPMELWTQWSYGPNGVMDPMESWTQWSVCVLPTAPLVNTQRTHPMQYKYRVNNISTQNTYTTTLNYQNITSLL